MTVPTRLPEDALGDEGPSRRRAGVAARGGGTSGTVKRTVVADAHTPLFIIAGRDAAECEVTSHPWL